MGWPAVGGLPTPLTCHLIQSTHRTLAARDFKRDFKAVNMARPSHVTSKKIEKLTH